MTFLSDYEVNLGPFIVLACLNGLYAVELPNVNSAGEFVRCFQLMFKRFLQGYTEGGASAICEAFARYVARKGGEVLTNAEVAKILVESGKVKGVELKDGSKFESDLVISTTGVKETVFKLVGRDHFPKEYVKKVEEIKHSLTAVCLRIALDEKVTDRPLFWGFHRET